MTFTEHTCVSLTCDTCGEHVGDEGITHFDSRDEATAYATRDDGYGTSRWVISGETAKCPECARAADCAATAHQWGDWRDRSRTVAGVPYRSRWCDHCGASDHDPPYDALVLFQRLADEREASA